jgi:hypothetical protein
MATNILLLCCGASLGAFVAFGMMLVYIFDSNKLVNSFVANHLEDLKDDLEKKVAEFDEVTKLASKANTSLGDRVKEIDAKIVELENRISMLRMQR